MSPAQFVFTDCGPVRVLFLSSNRVKPWFSRCRKWGTDKQLLNYTYTLCTSLLRHEISLFTTCVVTYWSILPPSSSELTQLSGVAAILRFPIADLSEGEEEDSSSDEDWSADTGPRRGIDLEEDTKGGRPLLQITGECDDSVCYKTIKLLCYDKYIPPLQHPHLSQIYLTHLLF